MPPSASELKSRGGPRRPARAAALALVVLSLPGLLGVRMHHSEEEALALVFPGASRIESRPYVLDPEARVRVARLCGCPMGSRVVTLHQAHRGEERIGDAIVLKEIAKTLPFRFLVAIRPDGAVDQVVLLTYREPRGGEIERSGFRAQYRGRTLEDPIRRGKDIRNITGATISVDSLSRGVRRALAIHAVLRLGSPPKVPAAAASSPDSTLR